MNKKANTILFMLIGTLASIIITILILLLLIFIVVKVFTGNQEAMGIAISIAVIASMILGAVIYQFGVKFVVKKFNMEDKLEPLFGRGSNRSKFD